MIDPNKRVIDPRSTVRGDEDQITVPAAGGITVPRQPSEDSGQQLHETPPRQTGTSSPASTSPAAWTSGMAVSVPDQFKGSSNQEIIDYLTRKVREHEPMTKEKLEKIRKRQKAEKIMSGISDAVRSVANLVAVHNYAPNMIDGGRTMSARAQERFDKEKAELKAEDDDWFNKVMMLGRLRDADKDRGLKIWNMEQTLARQERDYGLKLAENNAKVEKLQAEALEALKRGDLAEAGRKLKEAQTTKVETETKYIAPVKESEIRKNNAAANASNASANNSNASALSKGMHFDGKTYYTDEDYEKAVLKAARGYNERHKTVTKDANGKTVTQPAVPVEWKEQTAYGEKPHLHKASDLAATLEPLLEEERKNNRNVEAGAKSKGSGGQKSGSTGKKWSNTSKVKW